MIGSDAVEIMQNIMLESMAESSDEHPSGNSLNIQLIVNIAGAAVCVCFAALAAGLTMGLLSLDPLTLSIKERAGATEKERQQASSLLVLVKNHHLLLVSLLLMNALANEALPIFLNAFLPEWAAVIVSVTLVLLFGEILPTAIFTGPNQIAIASALAPVVRAVLFLLYPIAAPIAKLLDYFLHSHAEGADTFNRGELAALVRIQHEERVAVGTPRGPNSIDPSLDAVMRRSVPTAPSDPLDSQIRRSVRRKSSRITMKWLEQVDRNENRQDDIDRDEITMVEGALQMKTKTASDVYTPMREVFAISSDMILNEANVVSIYTSGYSRIPIFEKLNNDSSDRLAINGILFVRQLILINTDDKRPVSSLPKYVPFCVSPNMNLVDMVNLFQKGGNTGRAGHIALVCARPKIGNDALAQGLPVPDAAALMGIVTLEDVIEELIQEEIYDEFDKNERRHLELAAWGFQRWRLYTKRKRRAAEKVQRELNDSRVAEEHTTLLGNVV